MKEFQAIGELIENRWRAQNYSEQVFPEIAEQALAEADLPSRVDPWDDSGLGGRADADASVGLKRAEYTGDRRLL